MTEAESKAFKEAIFKRDRLYELLQQIDKFIEDNPNPKYLTESGYLNDFNPNDEGRHFLREDIAAMPEGKDKTFYALCDETRNLCNEVLIDNRGDHSDFCRFFIVRNYRVIVTSRDAFGPLSAAVIGKHFRIAYG